MENTKRVVSISNADRLKGVLKVFWDDRATCNFTVPLQTVAINNRGDDKGFRVKDLLELASLRLKEVDSEKYADEIAKINELVDAISD